MSPLKVTSILSVVLLFASGTARGADGVLPTLGSVNNTAVATELKTVKLYGAGGVAGLDAYQSGFFISDKGKHLDRLEYGAGCRYGDRSD